MPTHHQLPNDKKNLRGDTNFIMLLTFGSTLMTYHGAQQHYRNSKWGQAKSVLTTVAAGTAIVAAATAARSRSLHAAGDGACAGAVISATAIAAYELGSAAPRPKVSGGWIKSLFGKN